MSNWKRIACDIPTVPVALALSSVSALAGFDLAIVLTYHGATKDIAPMISMALGAALGATTTVAAALYNQRLMERRELRRPVGALLGRLRAIAIPLTTIEHRLRALVKDSTKNGWMRDGILKAAQEATAKAAAIEIDHALPESLASRLRTLIDDAHFWLELETVQRIQRAAEMPPGKDQDLWWASAIDPTMKAATDVKQAIDALREHTD